MQPPTKLSVIRNQFQILSKEDKALFLSNLSQPSYYYLRFHTDIMLRDNQIIHPGNWRYWLFIGGRGTGKSFTAATEIRKRVYANQEGLCVIAPTHQDLIKILIPAIQKEFPDHQKPIYIGGSKQIIKCHN